MPIKPILLTLLLSPFVLAQAPKPAGPPPTLKSVLLAQLRSTHNKAEWFVPLNTAVAGLTPEHADLEHLVEATDDAKPGAIANTIAHISTHNAYHTGQIIMIRKLQGSWDPKK